MLSKCMHGWQSGAGRQRVDANPLRGEEGIAANIQRIGSAFGRFDAWDDILRLHDFEPECIKAERDRRLVYTYCISEPPLLVRNLFCCLTSLLNSVKIFR